MRSLIPCICLEISLQKKTHPWHFGLNDFFLSCLWHFCDYNCHKTRYHHRCGWLLLLWQEIMTENGLFILGWLETQLHDILWAVHDRKYHGRSEGEENIGEFPVTVGGRGRVMHGGIARFSHTRTRVCEALRSNWTWSRCWALIKPKQLHCRLSVTEPERSIDPLLLTEAEWVLRYCC